MLAIDYLVFEMDSALVGCRFGEVVARLHSFPRPRSPAPASRSEDLGDGASQLLAASQLMNGLNSSQQVRLKPLLAETVLCLVSSPPPPLWELVGGVVAAMDIILLGSCCTCRI